MTDLNVYRCTPRQTRKFITRCLYANVVPFVQSSPGMGKSSIVHSISDELNLHLIDHRLSTSAPEDLSGLPRFTADGFAEFAPFADLFPLESTPLPEGKDGWLLFLDEFNSASKSVQAAAYKLILDRKVGQHKLHERVAVVCAGNLASDRALTSQLSTAMQSRLIHIEMQINFEEWLYDVALAQDYDLRIIAYLNNKNSALMDFRPDHNEKTFCCPRTWEFMNRLIKDKPVTNEDTPLYAGCITSGEAVEFAQFTQIFDKMVKIEDILNDPENCGIPSENSTRWAVISMMMSKIDENNFEDLSTYANRFDMTFRILFFRSVMVRSPALRTHPAFAKAMTQLSRYLHG